MDNEKYNGWHNRATWAFNLWITNTEGDYNYWLEKAKASDDINELAEKMKEYLQDLKQDIIDNPENTTKEARNMLMDIGEIENIDYYEVAKGFFEEAKEIKKASA